LDFSQPFDEALADAEGGLLALVLIDRGEDGAAWWLSWGVEEEEQKGRKKEKEVTFFSSVFFPFRVFSSLFLFFSLSLS